jgi:hypothetical protein
LNLSVLAVPASPRVKLPLSVSRKAKRLPFRLTASYIVQVTIAYWIMLLVMLYEAMIFIAIVLGLGTGYFAVLRVNRRNASKQEANHDQGSAQESSLVKNETPLSTSESDQGSNIMLDATYTSISPCCGDEYGEA